MSSLLHLNHSVKSESYKNPTRAVFGLASLKSSTFTWRQLLRLLTSISMLLASRISEYLGNNATDSGEIAKYAGGISVLTQTFRRNKYVGGNVRSIDNQKEAAKI